MKVIRPTAFVKATHLVDTTATESVAAWAVGTTYSAGQRVLYADSIYESVAGGNTGNQPDTSPAKWLRIGPGNIVAMFDGQASTVTSRASSLTVTLSTGAADSIALIGLNGQTLRILATDGPGGSTTYDETIALTGADIADWYEYFFAEQDAVTDVVRTNLPVHIDSIVILQLSGSGTVSIGEAIFGMVYDLGETLISPQIGITDYSVKSTDEYGETTFVQRAFSKKLSTALIVPNARLNRLTKTLTDLRARPSVWIGHERARYANTMIVYGYYRDFAIDIAYPDYSRCSLEIEGLT